MSHLFEEDFLILFNFFISSFLCGLIWLIQVVHYPSFFYVDESRFVDFEKFHSDRISYIVVPAMIIELVVACLLVYLYPSPLLKWSLSFVILIWFSTFFLSVPLHQILGEKHDFKVITRLIFTNWPRTTLWSAKTILAFVLVWPDS